MCSKRDVKEDDDSSNDIEVGSQLTIEMETPLEAPTKTYGVVLIKKKIIESSAFYS